MEQGLTGSQGFSAAFGSALGAASPFFSGALAPALPSAVAVPGFPASGLAAAGSAAGERDEARRLLAEVEARVRSLEERRATLEAAVRDRDAALSAARDRAEREGARAVAAERERDLLRKGTPRPAPAP